MSTKCVTLATRLSVSVWELRYIPLLPAVVMLASSLSCYVVITIIMPLTMNKKEDFKQSLRFIVFQEPKLSYKQYT